MTDIRILRDIIDDIDVLIAHKVDRFNVEFKIWHNKALRFLANHYGEESIEFKEFCKTKFTLSVSTDKTERYMYVEQCRTDLYATKGIFQNYLWELMDSDEDNSDNNNDGKDLERIFSRFKNVAIQLTRRYDNRDTLLIKDEYDVQDLLHTLLSLYFEDIRPEEWTPSYAGGSVRIDFLIPEIATVIEVKKTRETMNDKKLSEELIIDIEKYQTHPKCKKIYCFVYDPDCILRNPTEIKRDLEKKHKGLVRVFVET